MSRPRLIVVSRVVVGSWRTAIRNWRRPQPGAVRRQPFLCALLLCCTHVARVQIARQPGEPISLVTSSHASNEQPFVDLEIRLSLEIAELMFSLSFDGPIPSAWHI